MCRLGAGLDHFGKYLAFLLRETLDRLYKIGNEIGAPLILVEYLAPGSLGLFIE